MTEEARQLCTFTVGGLRLGVSVEEVQEVLRQPEVTPVPRASSVVRGLVNLRGQIVAAIDLRRRLGLPDRAPGDEASTVVVRTATGPAALIVDDIGDVVVVTGDMEPPPETLARDLRELAVGVHESEEGLLLVVAAEAAVEAPVE